LYRNPIVTTAESRHLETERLSELLPPDARVLNLGSGQFSENSTLFRQCKTRMVNLDIAPFGDVHIVGDAHQLPFFNNTFDLVYISHVLEHVRDASNVVQECHRILKPDGYLYSATPFVSRFHSDSDYRRWTLMGLDYLFRDFEKVASGIRCGPASAAALALREFFPLFFGSGYLHFAAKLLAGWLLTPMAYLDLLLVRNRYAYKLALAYYFLGRKKIQR
jgi:SAM-dependent methyltransferase